MNIYMYMYRLYFVLFMKILIKIKIGIIFIIFMRGKLFSLFYCSVDFVFKVLIEYMFFSSYLGFF